MERKAKPGEMMALDLMEQPQGKLYKGGAKPTYGEVSAELKKETISAAVRAQREVLATSYRRGKVDLWDTTAVRAQMDEYLSACEASGTIPTLLGLSAALGVSRSYVYDFCRRNSDSDTAQLIDAFRTAAADVLAQGALTRALDNSTSIFLLKNSGQQLADRHELELEAKPIEPLGDTMSPEEIAQKYALLDE